MLVHRCDRCCVYKKEIQPRRTKYRGIWAILMHRMMFPSKLQFCFKRYILRIPSVFCYRGNILPAYPLNHFAYPSLGTDAVEDYEKNVLIMDTILLRKTKNQVQWLKENLKNENQQWSFKIKQTQILTFFFFLNLHISLDFILNHVS